MRRERNTWSESLRSLSRSAGEVVGAELALLAVDYQRWGKRLAIAGGLILVAGWIVLWCLIFLLYTLVRVLESVFGLGVWQAPLAATGVALLLAVILVTVAFFILKRLGPPARAMRSRYREHRRWWFEQVLGEPDETIGEPEL